MRLFRALFDVFELCKCDGKLFCIFAINEPPMDPSSVTPLFLEDLSIGMKFSAGPRQITEQEIIAFAKQYDPQPFHTDPEAAKNTMFKGLAASGWHTVALTMVMLTEGGALPFANGVIGFGAEVSWLRPVRPGDILTIECEIMEITPSRSKPNQALVLVRTTASNQNGEPVQVLTSKNLVFKRGHAPSA
jgi:acyl dehydratase